MNKTLAELAHHVGGKCVGDGQIVIRGLAPIDEAAAGEITFLANPRYRKFLGQCRASAVIVGPNIVQELAHREGQGFIEAADPYLAFAKILDLFQVAPQFSRTVSPLAHVEPTADLGAEVTVFPQAYVCAGVKIGRRTVLYPGVFLGIGSEVGDDCVLHPNVVVREGCRLGNRVILHAGTVIGSDGFGYAGHGGGRIKIPQTGIVIVEDDVEIGANATVDRATLGRTVIGRGTKIDNLVQIAHNVVIGENSLIAAQTGIAGSTRIGKNVTLAGQVGVVNHLQIGDGATIGPQSGVAQSVAPGAVLSSGLPAAPHLEWLRVMALLPQLPSLWRAVRGLEKKVSQLAKGEG